MICDLFCVYFGDGIWAFKTTIKGTHFKSIIEASTYSEALRKADLNIKSKLWSSNLKFGRGGLQWNTKVYNIKDMVPGKTADENVKRIWYIDQDENGRIIPKNIESPLMTEEECKTYVLGLLFK